MNITAEDARKELRRRHRDPETGRKIKGKNNGHTDGRYTRRQDLLALSTKALLEIAHTPVQATAQVTPEVYIPAGYDLAWEDDIPVLHPVAA